MKTQLKEDNILSIVALGGNKLIAIVKNVFFYVDPNFFSWGLHKEGTATEKVDVNVIEVNGEISFLKIFESLPGKWNQKFLSQNQIVEFCEKISEEMKKVGNEFMFICKIDENELIDENNAPSNSVFIKVRVFSNGLRVYVHRLNDVNVWRGKVVSYAVIPVF